MENISTHLLTSWIKQVHTYEWISNELKVLFPEKQRGFSVRSVRRFCSNEGITKMDENELDEVVKISVDEVNWGKKSNFTIIFSINLILY